MQRRGEVQAAGAMYLCGMEGDPSQEGLMLAPRNCSSSDEY